VVIEGNDSNFAETSHSFPDEVDDTTGALSGVSPQEVTVMRKYK
jgi:hypothetical protein